MANAWILRPLDIIGATSNRSLTSPLNVANDYAGVVWRSGPIGGVDLIIDLGADQDIDAAMLFGCEGLTPAVTMQVFAAKSATGTGGAFDWADPAAVAMAGVAQPASGRSVALWQRNPANPPPSARYWLFRFAGLGATGLGVARVALGKRVLLERNFSNGASFGVRDLGSLDFSARGVLLRRRGAKLRTVGLTFSSLRKDEVEAMVQPLLERIGNTEMVGLITDPSPDPQRQGRCFFGSLVGDLGTVRRNAAAYEAKANLVSSF